MRTGPLTSLKVIELCNVVAGPFAGSLLADWGADVIKIEMPGKGDPFRAFLPYDDANHEVSLRWITMGRNKRCVTLDLHGEKGHKILLDLVKDADLVIENFRPGTLEKWGIGYDAMKAVNPKVVLATMGAILRVRVHYTELAACLATAAAQGIPVYGTFLEGENIYRTELTPEGIVVMGNEGRGVTEAVARTVTRKLFIPPWPAGRRGSESLNVAMATGIIC